MNNDALVLKRMKKMNEYLNYVNGHKQLSKNPVYLLFTHNDFERYKADIREGENIYSLWTNRLTSLFKTALGKSLTTKQDLSNKHLNVEKKRLEKILKGVALTLQIIHKFKNQFEIKSKALNRLFNITKMLHSSNTKLEVKEGEHYDYVVMKSNLKMKSECFEKLGLKYDLNKTTIEGITERLIRFQSHIIGMIEIFYRKEHYELMLEREQNNDFKILNNDQNEIGKTVIKINSSFNEELTNCHSVIEKEYIAAIDRFFNIKKVFNYELINCV